MLNGEGEEAAEEMVPPEVDEWLEPLEAEAERRRVVAEVEADERIARL